MGQRILLVVSGSWSVPILCPPQGGVKKAPLCLVEASQTPRAPILIPGERGSAWLSLELRKKDPKQTELLPPTHCVAFGKCLPIIPKNGATWPPFPGPSNEGAGWGDL